MKAILQRCLSASVTVESKVVSSIGKGILVFAAIGPNDTLKDVESMAAKVIKMKLWPDDSNQNWKRNVQEVDGEVLCGSCHSSGHWCFLLVPAHVSPVSQFTLYATTKKGNKPDFHGAAKPEIAKEMYDHFLGHVKKLYVPSKVQDGVFQAMMEVALVNDGPVTIEIETGAPKKPLGSTGTNTPMSESAP